MTFRNEQVIVLPTGATSGLRIILDGTTSAIILMDDSTEMGRFSIDPINGGLLELRKPGAPNVKSALSGDSLYFSINNGATSAVLQLASNDAHLNVNRHIKYNNSGYVAVPNYSANWSGTVQYIIENTGFISMRGTANKGVPVVNGETITTLPVGFRPQQTQEFICSAVGAFNWIKLVVLTSGAVQIFVPAALTSVSFDQVRFALPVLGA